MIIQGTLNFGLYIIVFLTITFPNYEKFLYETLNVILTLL